MRFSPSPEFSPPRRVAIFRALQLGDMLCAVPALRALREAWPDAHITLIGLPWASRFVERFSTLIDGLVVFPGARGFPEQEETDAGLPPFYAAMRARRGPKTRNGAASSIQRAARVESRWNRSGR